MVTLESDQIVTKLSFLSRRKYGSLCGGRGEKKKRRSSFTLLVNQGFNSAIRKEENKAGEKVSVFRAGKSPISYRKDGKLEPSSTFEHLVGVFYVDLLVYPTLEGSPPWSAKSRLSSCFDP